MKLLVILQNAYGVEKGYVPSYDDPIFKIHHTGRRLKRAIPENADLYIRNSTPEIGFDVDSFLKADEDYISEQILNIDPDAILVCGEGARKGVERLGNLYGKPFFFMPHPAYRALTNKTLDDIRVELENIKI